MGEKNNEFYFGKAEFELPVIHLVVNGKNYLRVEVQSLQQSWEWRYRFGSLSIEGNWNSKSYVAS